MAFVVQLADGGSVDDANAYVDEVFFRAYHADRGVDVGRWGDEEIRRAVVAATDYLDHRWAYVGEKTRFKQRTMWPRIGAYDDDELLRFGVPVEVREATSEYALIQLTQGYLEKVPVIDSTGRAVQAETKRVGPIEKSTTYRAGALYQRPRYPRADDRLRPLIVGSGVAFRG